MRLKHIYVALLAVLHFYSIVHCYECQLSLAWVRIKCDFRMYYLLLYACYTSLSVIIGNSKQHICFLVEHNQCLKLLMFVSWFGEQQCMKKSSKRKKSTLSSVYVHCSHIRHLVRVCIAHASCKWRFVCAMEQKSNAKIKGQQPQRSISINAKPKTRKSRFDA